jgi:hypothetical protein
METGYYLDYETVLGTGLYLDFGIVLGTGLSWNYETVLRTRLCWHYRSFLEAGLSRDSSHIFSSFFLSLRQSWDYLVPFNSMKSLRII